MSQMTMQKLKKGKTIWLMGLSGAGKSTIAQCLIEKLRATQQICFGLDGDQLRAGLNRNLGFSEQDRSENLRRAAELCKLLNHDGITVVAAFITPLEKDRTLLKSIIGAEDFFEIHIATPLEVCEQRDVKGLYQKARLGLIENFTGITASYEVPQSPFLTINTVGLDVDQCAIQILNKIFI
ncbi:adenylyl-sulfate kinase [Acinetobacter wuhouensis]|nr:adenylyl-sulfate kinase [Acinetobacter wuhouensis]